MRAESGAGAPVALSPVGFVARQEDLQGEVCGPVRRGIGCSMRDWSKLLARHCEAPAPRRITVEEVQRHSEPDDLWIVVRDVVYDCTKFQRYHPGGEQILRKVAGMDCTEVFDHFHSWVSCESVLGPFAVGTIEKSSP